MNIEINWIAVLIAVVASMVLAKVWYSKKALGNPWRKLTGITPSDSKKAGKKPIVTTLFANIVTVVVLADFIDMSSVFRKNSSVWNALLTGFVAWLAFSATTLVTHNSFEQKKLRLTIINTGYQLALFLIAAAIIGWVGV